MIKRHNFPVPFQNMNVDVPIISVKKYLRNGYDFHFTEEGGYMRCRLNNRTFHFIEAEGAYWIKLKIQNPDSAHPVSTGFSRPLKLRMSKDLRFKTGS